MFAKRLSTTASLSRALSWTQLQSHAATFTASDPIAGPTSSQATLRLFGQPESDVRVTLYRDNHAWCPYCQKCWLFLEEKQIPYRIEKVTMFCYGQKESWYKRIVPSGMLPALQLDGQIITESDVVLHSLEQAFGPLGEPMAEITPHRRLERQLFRAWCDWLCRPDSTSHDQAQFEGVLALFEAALGRAPGPWLDGGEAPSLADLTFVPCAWSPLEPGVYSHGNGAGGASPCPPPRARARAHPGTSPPIGRAAEPALASRRQMSSGWPRRCGTTRAST